MLNKLFNKLQSIIPIKELANINNSIVVGYFENNQPDATQLEQINSIIQSWPLEKAKLLKIKQLDDNWKTVIKNGWQSPDGYTLGIDIQDISLLNGAFTLAKETSLMGINGPTTIVDIHGISHSLLLPDLTMLMLQYGQARAELSGSYAAIKQSINSATSIEEIDSIDLTIGA